METKHSHRKKRLLTKKLTAFIIATLAVVVVSFLVTLGYSANGDAMTYLFTQHDGVSISQSDGDVYVIPDDGDYRAGLIFYPGAFVDNRSYAPLLGKLGEQGIMCVCTDMPADIALLGVNAADGIREQYPDIRRWYIGGHSLGAWAASIHLKDNADIYEGFVMLAGYSKEDLSATGLRVLSVYGENDGILNRDRYAGGKTLLPGDFTEFVIPGGCHAYFGSYGEQSGDGKATVTAEEQQTLTADAVSRWIG